ncbi:MAG: ammonium transporter [Nitrospiria bacterium]
MKKIRLFSHFALPIAFVLATTAPLWAEGAPTTTDVQKNADFVWTLIAAFLVFFMQAGFAAVEAGFTRAKNAVNILMKNLFDFSFGSLAFWAIGFGLMFGASAGGFIGTSSFFLSDFAVEKDPWVFAFWLFQCVFAATAATIVSGAMAERTKFTSYLITSAVVCAVIYPIFGSWAWGSLYKGSGWLEGLGFIDFAGSTVVHSVGGWIGLAGAVALGPRIGKYAKDGKARAIPGHNLPLATIGVFILWFGWFGFNPGSTTAAITDIAMIAANTNLAAAAGAVAAMAVSWKLYGKPDLGMSLNGALAGLVAITAPCANVSPASAVIIGLIGGALVVFSVLFFDKIKIDDPVGAISVHGVCGAWGTLAAGLFDMAGFSFKQVGVQLVGIGAAFIWAFGLGMVLFLTLKATVGLRVSEEEEMEGLDLLEHGNSAYPDFGVSMISNTGPLPGVQGSIPGKSSIQVGAANKVMQ